MAQLSRSQIDRLGERLRLGPTREDIDLVIEYRDAHAPALAQVLERIHALLPERPITSRLKNPVSVVEKLHRETIRLTQMQDLAGCRIVADTSMEQDDAAAAIGATFAKHRTVDSREQHRFGYRAVHVVVETDDRLYVEVQVRTEPQDLWAQLSEKFAETFGPDIKYGGGGDLTRSFLDRMSIRGREVDIQIADIQQVGEELSGAVTSARERQIAAELAGYRAVCMGLIRSMEERRRSDQ